ncbi:MAG: SurA N-terminal domain-containing protein [Aquificaceae bacterium]|nr:SurA N-terminal domain-containing protein [Aquificaceae bacterium]MDW8096835.1 SurA N-terminal domain-containing protein [Aquificaceae bacterium]
MVSGSFKKILGGILLWTALSFPVTLVDRVVASVNAEPILESDIKMGMLFYEGATRGQVLEKLVENTLLYQFLTSRGLQVSNELVEEALQSIAKNNSTTVEGIGQELRRHGLTLQDLRRFLSKEILVTQGLRVFLERDVALWEKQVELERQKLGQTTVVREVELIVVDRKQERRLREVFDPRRELQEMAKALGTKVERLKVSRGELVDVLDREVWKTKVGELVLAEDEEHIYVARVLSQQEVLGGKTVEELMQEILLKRIEKKRRELLERLKKNSFVKVFQ